MRLDNLDIKSMERFKSDLSFIKEVLGKELEDTKEDLLDFPKDKMEETRGRAIVLRRIIKLLG